MPYTTHAPHTHHTHTTRRITHACLTSLSHNSDARPRPHHHGHRHLVTNHALKSPCHTRYKSATILSFLIVNAYIHAYTVQIDTTMFRLNAMNIPVFSSQACDTTASVDCQLRRGKIISHKCPHCNSCCPLISHRSSHVALTIASSRYTSYSAPSRDFHS
jgi:hypothetical protein